MIVAIYFPFDKARFFKGWTPRTWQGGGFVLTTPDLDKAKSLTAPMADRLADRINAQGGDALVLATGQDVLFPDEIIVQVTL